MAPRSIPTNLALSMSDHTDGTASSAFGGVEKTAAPFDEDEGFAEFEFTDELNTTLPGAESAAGTILEEDATDSADSTPATTAKAGVSTVAGGTAGSARYPLVFDQRSYNSVLDEYVLDGCVLGLEEEEEWDAEFDEEETVEKGTAEPQMPLQQDETFWVGEETGPEMPAVWAADEVEVGMMAELEPWVVEMGVEMDFDQFINIEMLAGEEATLPLRPLKRKGTAVADEREQKMVRVE
ncbi:hypothetical protein LTR10_000889 [Elasticomyces elasticus]|nr:hypothetical protein LTR10_000889 [Elasticomyces elasticus]KAK4979864.1 hypothetical protein LTR42_000171 [Elasticomyces elasticus]